MKTKKTSRANLESKRTRFFLIGLVFALAITLSAFEWGVLKKETGSGGFIVNIEEKWNDVEELIPLPVPKASEQQKVVKSPKINPVEELTEQVEGKSEDEIPELNFDEDDYGNDEPNVKEKPIIPPAPYTSVQEMPKFNCSNNSDKALFTYLQSNINYPSLAKKLGKEGTVYVEFVVDKKGKVKQIKARNEVGGGCTEEALRVIKEMPDWCPGQQGNETVPVLLVIPIKFSLAG